VSRKIKKFLIAYPHLEELNKYSLKVLGLVEKVYPGWIGYAQVGEFEGQKYLEIKIPAPYEPTEHDLMITTLRNDLTVYFDYYHTHFGRWYATPEEAFEQASLYIKMILQEELIVAVKMVDGRQGGAGGYSPDKLAEIKEGEVSYTRSWRGTYNRNYESH
jgi:hypothetical protein